MGFLTALFLTSSACMTCDPELLRFDLGLTFSHFQQQVKSELGGPRGDRLVEETEFGVDGYGTWRFWGPFSAGLFLQLDAGSRSAGRFDGFGADGAPTITGSVGGSYLELWAGPVVRAQWRGLFGEVGWGALGLRSDDARSDLPNELGDADGLFRTTPAVAWLLGIGASIEVFDQLDVVLRLTYRIRYYATRGGEDLASEMVHGSQNITPFIGVAYRIDREAD